MTDPRLDRLLEPAVTRLVAGMTQAIDKTGAQLGMLALAANSNAERQALMNAEYDLQRRCTAVGQAFARDLGERIAKDLQRQQPEGAAYADTDWTALRLVENAEVEETVTAARLTRLLEIDTDATLRELRGYFVTLQGADTQDDVFPLRPAIVGKALLKAVTQASEDADAQQQLARVLAVHASAALKTCYEQLLGDCRQMGVEQAPLLVRKPAGHTGSPGLDRESGHSSTSGAPLSSRSSELDGASDPAAWTPPPSMKKLGDLFGMALPSPQDLQAAAARVGGSGSGGGTGGGSGASSGSAQGPAGDADSSMLGLMRRLQSLSAMSSGWALSSPGGLPSGEVQSPANLIRAHREELVQASGGAALDQMVIDIVATLFDQVLSDPKVPPQMARQIGRLQLPVLRVALRDQTFFHSRKHPVRRLVNRMASLAVAFDRLDEGPGHECIKVVTELVREIVEGDFDRPDIYESKLAELERFVASQNERDVEESAAVAALLSGKEADLRVQQRYMQQVRSELADLEAPDFLKEFLAQIWTQVQVMVAVRHGPESDKAVRMRKASHQLVLSVQPKGHPSLRQDFLRQLPQLMKDLHEGLDMIQWAAEAKEGFFAQLLPLHAEALKAPPPHDLTLRLLEQRLRKVEQLTIPTREDAANDPLPAPSSTTEPGPLAMAATMTPQEAQSAGWVSEASLLEDTGNGGLDIDLSAGDEPDLTAVDLDLPLDTPAPPSAGPSLVNFIQPGAAYRMLLKGQWKKVRLTWVSEGRTFFMFTQGHSPSKQTISLTARTLTQMCASGRFKAFEQAQLLERATIRARRQLAALGQTRNTKVAA
ncbi:MAG TPA: DUF1631 domain-containing protein [Candidatus Aquabacterium excrementipullorum]|nr:DUF1631 domain-containing protein [Candidatus Aquabacterium excrementipullorum]